MDIAKAFGEVIRNQRRERGLSQERFGELAGLHRTYVGMLERGEKNITLTNIVKVAQALEMPASELLRLTEERL